MSAATDEIIEVCKVLPPDKQCELADFAKSLLTREDDDRWEELIASPERRPRLEAFLRESATEGDESLDLERL